MRCRSVLSVFVNDGQRGKVAGVGIGLAPLQGELLVLAMGFSVILQVDIERLLFLS